MRGYLCDERLIDLVSLGGDAIEMALILAQTQGLTYQQTGHVIALNDEYVWRRIKAAASGKGYRQIGVRCIGCNAVAPLGWWIDAARENPVELGEGDYRRLPPKMELSMRYLGPCDGHKRACKMLESLDAILAHQEGIAAGQLNVEGAS